MGCEVCGQAAPEHIWRCEKHYCCTVCETKEDLTLHCNMLICQDCRNNLIKKQIAEFTDSTYHRDEIICPWCGREGANDWDIEYDDDFKCDFCDQRFHGVRNVEVTYTTTKAGNLTIDEFVANLKKYSVGAFKVNVKPK